MDPLTTTIAILLADWGAAASHMAYDISRRKPFYDRPIPIWGDMFHLIAGLRYIPILLLVWYGFGWHDLNAGLSDDSWGVALWTAGTALVDWHGWLVLKKVHSKPWGSGVWERWR
jgi:hypothetical protein